MYYILGFMSGTIVIMSYNLYKIRKEHQLMLDAIGFANHDCSCENCEIITKEVIAKGEPGRFCGMHERLHAVEAAITLGKHHAEF